jgi:glycerate kinase
VAPDKFRGSLTANQAASAMARGVRRALGECLVLERPLADGGEGSLDVLAAVGFRAVAIRVHGPSGQNRKIGRKMKKLDRREKTERMK